MVRVPTEPGFERSLEQIAAAATAVAGDDPPDRAGVAAPGPLDPRRGLVLRPPNMVGWPAEAPLGARLARFLGMPVAVDNDANVAALGEQRAGAGRGVENLVYFTVSTGIGGGVILGGKLLHGAHGYAGELGHQVLVADGPPCGCGGRGCLEALASGSSIARIARSRIDVGERSVLAGAGPLTATEVFAAASQGDALARSVVETAMGQLGLGVVNALHLFDPALVIVGGGLTNTGDQLFGPVRRVVQTQAMPAFRETPIVRAALGDDAGLYGAAYLAWEAA